MKEKRESFLNLDSDGESRRTLLLLFQICETPEIILTIGRGLIEREM